MDLALAIAKSGMEAQHQNLEIISHNLANASTTSFKKSRAEFQDLPYNMIRQPGAPTTTETNGPNGIMMGSGTKLVGNSKIYSDGSAIITNRPLDVAIQGRGFLQVQIPNGGGYAYTRAGNLQINETGQLTLPNGYVVQPPITLPTQFTNLTISKDGIVSASTPGNNMPQQIGQLQLADFVNADALQPMGENLYLETTSSGTVTLGNPDNEGYGVLSQNQLEGSNVNVVEEMVNLIEAQRAFEVTSKAVSAVDSMMDDLNRTT